MHAYRTHTCGALRIGDAGDDGPARRLGAPQARPRPAAVRRSARPLRHHAMRDRHLVAAIRRGGRAAARKRRVVHREGGRALAGHGQPEPRRPARSSWSSTHTNCCRPPSHCRSRSTATPNTRRTCGSAYRFLDLRRERVHANIMLRSRCHRLDPPAHDRAGLFRISDADPDRQLAGGGARLSGAEPAASGHVLCAAAGAAAVQAIADGRRVRPLFPDRAVLSRRGQPRRPLARRVLPARFRDVVCHAGGRVRGDRAGACTASSRSSGRAGR